MSLMAWPSSASFEPPTARDFGFLDQAHEVGLHVGLGQTKAAADLVGRRRAAAVRAEV